jgi:hypothetical protein
MKRFRVLSSFTLLLVFSCSVGSLGFAQSSDQNQTLQRIIIITVDGQEHEIQLNRSGSHQFNLHRDDSADSAISSPETSESETSQTPVEFGQVGWKDDYDAAVSLSRETGKPLMILFQEVPGCLTCRNFGGGPLSHPLVIDGAQEFIPVVVKNNVEGRDREILNLYDEPTWNNPVVRFCDADGKDLIARKGGVYTTGELLQRMIASLEAAERPVPKYLELAAFEYAPTKREWATFGMFCYWVGEQKLGRLPGVLSTQIGMLPGSEVVDVQFDPTVTSYEELLAEALKLECARKVFARTEQQQTIALAAGATNVIHTDEETDTSTQQQHHLFYHKKYHYLPLTALQATKLNSAIANNEDPDLWLSPTQLELKDRILSRLEADPDLFEGVTPDRSSGGVVKYAERLELILSRNQ